MSNVKHNQATMKDGAFKLNIQLPSDAWHKFESESVWAEAVDDGVMCILNSPFFAKGISYKDVVSITVVSELMWLDSVVKKSGHSTYRLLLNDSTSDIVFDARWKDIASLGCTYESFISESLRIFSVDIPPGVDVSRVYALFVSGEKDGVWGFDEGDYVPGA